jgi:hypothetical protein
VLCCPALQKIVGCLAKRPPFKLYVFKCRALIVQSYNPAVAEVGEVGSQRGASVSDQARWTSCARKRQMGRGSRKLM